MNTSGKRLLAKLSCPSFAVPAAAVLVLLGSLVAANGFNFFAEYESGIKWAEPKVVDPGPPGRPPADAIVLFDGKDLSQWTGGKWIVKDGYMIAHEADLETKRLRRLPTAPRMGDARKGRRQRPGPRQQRRVAHGHR